MDPWETKPAEGEKKSVWKKEISFRRKPKAAAAAEETVGRKPSRKERRADTRLAKADAKVARRTAKADAKRAEEDAKAAAKVAKQQAKEDGKAAKAAKREKPAKEPKEPKPSRRARRVEAKRATAEEKQVQSERKRELLDRPRA